MNAIEPVLHDEIIDSLRAPLQRGGRNLYAQLIDAFVEDGTDRLNTLGSAVVARDSTAAQWAAHSLQGMSAALEPDHRRPS